MHQLHRLIRVYFTKLMIVFKRVAAGGGTVLVVVKTAPPFNRVQVPSLMYHVLSTDGVMTLPLAKSTDISVHYELFRPPGSTMNTKAPSKLPNILMRQTKIPMFMFWREKSMLFPALTLSEVSRTLLLLLPLGAATIIVLIVLLL